MPQEDGVADHAASTKPTNLSAWLANARKAVLAFFATGLLSGFGDALAHFDFSDLSWANLWTGLLSGLIGSVIVYVVRNSGFVRVDPALERTVEDIVRERLGTYEKQAALPPDDPYYQ